jgi:hypothetical protein
VFPIRSSIVSNVDDVAIRALVVRLSRPHPSGGDVIERAAILAEGADSADIVGWITDHAGQPESATPQRSGGLHGGLHAARAGDGAQAGRPPLRYVLPAGALD